MQEVTCPQCENIVQITPDASNCSVCDVDLRALIDPEVAASYFYQRASDMASAGHRQQALTEVNRGLTYFDTSDLRLLGAILSNQVGDYSQMRNHVAAIPVDDALRSEGEWLLRSHQAKQRGRRASAKSTQGAAMPAALQETDADGAATRGGQRTPWPLILAFAILILLALLWFIGLPGTRDEGETAALEVVAPEVVAPTAAPAEEEPMIAASDANGETSAAEANPENEQATDTESVEPGSEQPSPTPEPTEMPEPTVEPMPEEVGATGPVDVSAYLNEQGYVGLDQFVDVEGELDDGVLKLSGEVSMMEDMELLVDVVGSIEGTEEVDITQVTLSPPISYTIQVGDSLWTISVRVYGDTEHMDDIYRLNREELGSPEYLPVGAEIILPRPTNEEDFSVAE